MVCLLWAAGGALELDPPGGAAVPEVPGGGNLPHQDGEAGEDRAVARPGAVQVQPAVQVAAEQVELRGLQVLRRLHCAPYPLRDLQEELYLSRDPIEILFRLSLILKNTTEEQNSQTDPETESSTSKPQGVQTRPSWYKQVS